MKKFLLLILSVVLGLSVIGLVSACEPPADYTVGVVQVLPHPALDKASNGFKDELTKLMKENGKTVKVIIEKGSDQNSGLINTICNNFVAKNVDMIMANATPAAQAAVNSVKDTDIPVVFTSVTDPVAAGLIESIEKPNKNVTGTSDMNPIFDDQIALIAELVPGIQKIAIMYNTAETNSVVQYELAKEEAEKLEIDVVDAGITDTKDIQAKMQALSNDTSIGAIYIPTDNMLANAAAQVHNVNKSLTRKLPIVCGETSMNEKCGIATYGIDYYDLGVITARMAFEILFEGKDPADMAVQYSEKVELTISEKNAQDIGFTIPQSIKDRLD